MSSDKPIEAAYDEHVAPLMTTIIKLCAEHKIPFAAQFLLDADEDGEPLCCTTVQPNGEATEALRRQMRKLEAAMYPQPQFMAFTIRSETRVPAAESRERSG